LLDGGVHFIAGLRWLLSARGQDIQQLAAFTALLQPKLAPVDTVHAIMATTKGRIGTFSVSFGTEFKSSFEIEVVTTEGAVTVTPAEVTITRRGGPGGVQTERKEFGFSAGVKPEMEAFGKSIQTEQLDPRQSPAEALKDLAILQGMLESAQGHSHVQLS